VGTREELLNKLKRGCCWGSAKAWKESRNSAKGKRKIQEWSKS